MTLYPEELIELVQRCAAELQQECIRRTGMIHVEAAVTDRRSWRGPSMRSDLRLGPIDLNDLPRLLYGQPVEESAIVRTWETVAEFLRYRAMLSKVRPVLVNAVPHVPLNAPPGSGPQEWIAQWMQACAWQHGRFTALSNRVTLELPGGEIGLDGKAIVTFEGHRRYRHLRDVRTWDALRYPLGDMRRGLTETCAVYRHLLAALPGMVRHIDTVFSTAVAAGREFERAIVSLFDVIPLPGAPTGDTAWAKCRYLIEACAENPTPQLYELLGPVIGYEAFVKHFGNPSRQTSNKYTARQRSRHRAILARVESGEVTAAKLRLTGSELGQEVVQLLDLQQIIGST